MSKKIIAITAVLATCLIAGGCIYAVSRPKKEEAPRDNEKEAAISVTETETEETEIQNEEDNNEVEDSNIEDEESKNTEDPVNIDPTQGTMDGKKDEEIENEYTGTWTASGIYDAQGNKVEDCPPHIIKIKKDKKYVIRLSDGENITDEEEGKWSLGSDKSLILNDRKLGMTDDNVLLLETGERSGKGFKLYYGFEK